MRMTAVLATTGLLALTACGKKPEATAIDQNAALIQASLERQADALEAIANNATDPNTAEALDAAADELEQTKANVADAAHAAKARLPK